MKITHELLNSLNELNKGNEVYKTFNSLFIDAVKYGAITRPANETETEKQKIFHEGMFKVFCIIKFGDDSVKHFDQLLTKELFLQYLKYDKKRTDRIMKSWKVETDNFDSDETTSPKQKGEKMKLELLDNLFIPAMTAGAKPTKLELLKEDLRRSVFTYLGKEVTALADVIYKSGLIHKNVKPKNFTDWLKQFCNIIDYPLPTYKQEQKAVKEEYSKMKNTYHYLIP